MNSNTKLIAKNPLIKSLLQQKLNKNKLKERLIEICSQEGSVFFDKNIEFLLQLIEFHSYAENEEDMN